MEETSTLQKKTSKIFKKIGLVFVLFFVLFYLYIRFVEPRTFVVREYAIVDNLLPSSFHGLKIVHFSDVLYGSSVNENNLKEIVAKINELKPDVLIFTGDLFNRSIRLNEEEKNKLKEILKPLSATYKKYAIIGDNDFMDKTSYSEIMESADFMILNNKNDALYYKGNDPILFIGTNSLLENEHNRELASTLNEEMSTCYKIWLNHEPEILDKMIDYTVKPNLIFAGHTLNGLVSMPFGGTLFHQEGTSSYIQNYYEKDGIKMYISNGLGTYKYNVRFLNYPSISLYRLYQY